MPTKRLERKRLNNMKPKYMRSIGGSRERFVEFMLDTPYPLIIFFFLALIAAAIVRGITLHEEGLVKSAEAQELLSPIPTPTITPTPTATPTPTEEPKNERVQKLKSFLIEQKSPLAPYAELIVEQADKYDISWTLATSISGKESSFGKEIKPGSYNAWGVMAWDANGKRYIRSFNSWEEGIIFETKLISKHYRENMNKAIQEKYCPSFECSPTWVQTVTEFQEAINNE